MTKTPTTWSDDLPGRSWASLWSGYVVCGCGGIRKITEPCPVCAAEPYDLTPQAVLVGDEAMIVNPIFAGAEGRYEDYVYLQMLQREWERPTADFEHFAHFSETDRPSAKAALVLLFWGYFETRIERLHRAVMKTLPPRIVESQLRRYSGIGSRLFELYQILFDTTYFDDLSAHGFGIVSDLLRDTHRRRNAFAHGSPQAINDEAVTSLVSPNT